MIETKEYCIEDLKKKIAGQTKPQQQKIIEQEKRNYLLLKSSGHTKNSSFQYQKRFGNDIDLLLNEIASNNSFKYDCDWNWFFNADNIPNQEIVFATKDFLDSKKVNEADGLFIMNILLRQIDELALYLEKPIDFINKINSLPLDKTQKYTLLGLLLKWHGGYPINNLNVKYNTLLKLVEREFLQMFPDGLMPEKEFCKVDIKAQKALKEIEAHANAQLNRQFSFTGSKYIKKLSIDFEDLPEYIIQKGIIWKFEEYRFINDGDYLRWREKLLGFMQTIPSAYTLKMLTKGIEYAKKVYDYHLRNECTDKVKCHLNQIWERKIAIAENILEELSDKKEAKETNNFHTEDEATSSLPILELSSLETLWLQEVYEQTKKGSKFTFKEIWGKLHNQLSLSFHPEKMDERLISKNGEEIQLLGVIALEKNFTIIEKINRVMLCIRKIILEDPKKRNILISEIVQASASPVEEVSLALHLVRAYGRFYSGCGFDTDNTIFKSIDVGGEDAIYYQYIRFNGIEQLVALKSYQSYIQPGEEFTADEMKSVSDKLDTILKDLEILKTGHEIIWTDLVEELNELKAYFGLNKKNWKQLLAGKIVDMVASGIISEAVSKQIVEHFKPVIGKLINY